MDSVGLFIIHAGQSLRSRTAPNCAVCLFTAVHIQSAGLYGIQIQFDYMYMIEQVRTSMSPTMLTHIVYQGIHKRLIITV